MANGYADGWRERDGVTSFGFNAYGFDPQGSLAVEDSSFNTTLPAQNVYVYDGYGDRLVGERVSTGSTTAFNIDPVQFGGQYGYYTDLSTGEVDLTHRYYDPSTGHFLNRDPIGYNGGQNLYAFCGNNPITRSDPNGTDVANFIDHYLLNDSISHWGTVQGRYDAGKASKAELALAAVNGSGQTVLLAFSIVDGVGGAKALPALAKAAAKDIPNLASRTGVIAYRKLAEGTLGETDWVGNITLDISLKGKEATLEGMRTLAHENVHAARVGDSVFSAIVHHIGYNGSSLYKFYEEFSAEYTATSEFWHIFHGAAGYIEPAMFAREANVAAHVAKPAVTGVVDHL